MGSRVGKGRSIDGLRFEEHQRRVGRRPSLDSYVAFRAVWPPKAGEACCQASTAAPARPRAIPRSRWPLTTTRTAGPEAVPIPVPVLRPMARKAAAAGSLDGGAEAKATLKGGRSPTIQGANRGWSLPA